MQVKINYARIGKETQVFHEGLVEDNGTRLKTFSIIPIEYRTPISEAWWRDGFVPHGQLIYSLGKNYFYNEHFDVLEPRDEAGNLLGYYCDIATPLQKIDGEYFLTDLFLDLWIAPGLTSFRELDWDEFEAAVASGLLSADLQEKALSTVNRLRAEIGQGLFPSAYIR
jgi:protein associated with RNAse G/E